MEVAQSLEKGRDICIGTQQREDGRQGGHAAGIVIWDG